jgi:hypothetical protein
MSGGGRREGAGRKNKTPPTLEESLRLGGECQRWHAVLIRWLLRKKLRAFWKAHPAGENHSKLLKFYREIRAIPAHLRPLAGPKDDEEEAVEIGQIIGLAGAQIALGHARGERQAFLEKLGRMRLEIGDKDEELEIPADPMPAPPTFSVPAFPRGYRDRIIAKVQEDAHRRHGKRFTENEIAEAWTMIRSVEGED